MAGKTDPAGINIYVMDRAFVVVGETITDDGEWVHLKRCAVVRKYGTTHGLGQIARGGPTKETILDSEPEGTAIHLRYVLRRIPCNVSAWNKHLAETAYGVKP